MPKKTIDYSKVVMYKLVCNDIDVTELYVGHTTSFAKRKQLHKSACNNQNDKRNHYYVYQFIRENGGWENWSMIKIEDYPCDSYLEACKRERFHIESLKAKLNKVIPSRTYKEYYHDNKEKIAIACKQYAEIHKDKIAVYQQEYQNKNKEKIAIVKKQYVEIHKDKIAEYQKEYVKKNKENLTYRKQSFECECGVCYTYNHKTRHFATQRHINYVNSLDENKLEHTIKKGLELIKLIDSK